MNTPSNSILAAAAVFTILLAGVPHSASAALSAADNAGNSAYNDGWQNGDNGGTGWGSGWVFRNGTQFSLGDSSTNGNGDSAAPFGDINTSGRAWGIGTAGNPNNFTLAGRDLSGTLDVGQKVIFDFDNGFGGGSGSLFAVVLRNTTTSGAYESLWGFAATGISTYYIEDTGFQSVTIPAFTDEGLHIEFTLTSATTYSVDINALGGAPTTYTGSLRTPGSGDQIIRSFSFGALDLGNSASQTGYINNIQIVPEPSTAFFGVMAAMAGILFRRTRKARNG